MNKQKLNKVRTERYRKEVEELEELHKTNVARMDDLIKLSNAGKIQKPKTVFLRFDKRCPCCSSKLQMSNYAGRGPIPFCTRHFECKSCDYEWAERYSLI